ncbi:lipoyl(octanoyl) transferase LipB [Nesterenkonia sp. CL21]|uniref:lipoyl(octanoyl) transferase LipB n=1 Tax=unclassified Nesterenkonia TaxID=2629769 RepID=UPI00287B166B|nr:lipoyl(octanoyl) transferase LipB [Nesterenkonia sp. CL21]MDS2171914.1 lipoyl(octanoyl) transferase LipB [Nesterenkonia sp. CL21]
MDLAFRRLGFHPDVVDYAEALDIQRRLHAEVLADESPSTVLLLEHEDVYTAGRRTEPEDRPRDGTPVVDVDRGGKITWHGRGQLVGYPILKLAERAMVKGYVAALEEIIIRVLDQEFGLRSTTVEGRSGVWMTDGPRDRKIAAIGLRVHRSVTMHGFALNCSNSLAPFENIIPCGIADADTTTISAEVGTEVTPADIVDPIAAQLAAELPRFLSVTENIPAAEGVLS